MPGGRGVVAEDLELEQILRRRVDRCQREDKAEREQPLQLERHLQGDAGRARNRRMEVKVFDRFRLVFQSRFEEVIDIRHLGVQKVEALDSQPDAFRELVANLTVHDRRLFRLDAVVLEQRPRSEVAQPQAAERHRWRPRRAD